MELSDDELANWDGYSLDIFGWLYDSSSDANDGQFPTWTIKRADADMPPSTVRIVRQWARHGDSKLYAQQLCLPKDQERCSIEGLQLAHDDTDIDHARNGLSLLRTRSLLPRIKVAIERQKCCPLGKHRGMRHSDWEALARKIDRRYGQTKSLKFVAGEFRLTRKTVRTWLDVLKVIDAQSGRI
jgi:hypothetical protein